jgi:hypothetical protein
MTRKEAYEKAREDWDFEEKAFYEVGKYRHDTDTVLWLANLTEAEELLNQIAILATRLNEDVGRDQRTLAHYAPKNDNTSNRFGMNTIDLDGSQRLVAILTDVLGRIKGFQDEARRY